MSTTITLMASDSQVNYFTDLLDKHVMHDDIRERGLLTCKTMTAKEVSDAIDWVLRQPVKATFKGEGLFVGGSGTHYVTKKAKGKSYLITKAIKVYGGTTVKYHKVGFHAAKTDVNTGGRRMTEAEAIAYGKYGICICCGRTLTNPESVALGIGPICRQNTIWG